MGDPPSREREATHGDGFAGQIVIPLDTRQQEQILDVLTPQHLQQRLARHDPERTTLVIHDSQRIDAMMQGQRCRDFLIRRGCHAGKLRIHRVPESCIRWQREEPGERHRAREAAGHVGHQHQIRGRRPRHQQTRQQFSRGLVDGRRHAGRNHVRADQFARRLAFPDRQYHFLLIQRTPHVRRDAS